MKKDWHPGSDGLVLDLVHPSLYCLVYGRTQALDPQGSGNLQPITTPTAPIPDLGLFYAEWALSDKFAWIPSDFVIARDGSSAKVQSYINNLQQHPDMYPVIERLVVRFVSLWDRVLTDMIYDNRNSAKFSRINERYAVDEENLGPEPPMDDETEDYTLWEERRPEFIIPPTVPDALIDITKRKIQYTLRGRSIQVIVKLANIHLV
jgi:hypothetical protein